MVALWRWSVRGFTVYSKSVLNGSTLGTKFESSIYGGDRLRESGHHYEGIACAIVWYLYVVES